MSDERAVLKELVAALDALEEHAADYSSDCMPRMDHACPKHRKRVEAALDRARRLLRIGEKLPN